MGKISNVLLNITSVGTGAILFYLYRSVAHASQRVLNFTKKHLKTHSTFYYLTLTLKKAYTQNK